MDIRLSSSIPLAYAYNAGPVGRISVPVSPAQLLYSNFKNVIGISDPDAASYSLDKLKILDTLIDRLRSIKRLPEQEKASHGISNEKLDAMIEEYGRELHSAIISSQAPLGTPYGKPYGVNPGFLVSVAA